MVDWTTSTSVDDFSEEIWHFVIKTQKNDD
jgi:hypothetical protein